MHGRNNELGQLDTVCFSAVNNARANVCVCVYTINNYRLRRSSINIEIPSFKYWKMPRLFYSFSTPQWFDMNMYVCILLSLLLRRRSRASNRRKKNETIKCRRTVVGLEFFLLLLLLFRWVNWREEKRIRGLSMFEQCWITNTIIARLTVDASAEIFPSKLSLVWLVISCHRSIFLH